MKSSEIDRNEATPDPRPLHVPPITVPMHGLTRYLRVRLGATDGVVRWHVPRSLLGVIPMGIRHISVPAADVASLRVGRVVRPFNLLAGIASVVVPLVFGLWWLAMPLGIFGLWVILVSLGPRLDMVTLSGTKHHASVCFGHQIDADLYVAAITDLAAGIRSSVSPFPTAG